MSSGGDDRWRGGRGYDSHRQRHQGGNLRGRPMGDGSGGGGNSGHHNDRHGGHRNHGNNIAGPHAWGPPPPGPGKEQHVPVRGFNSAEAKDALKKGCQTASSGGGTGPSPVVYKSNGNETNNHRSSGAWGPKANSMANGKDFFLELRKQVGALQQGGSNVQGG